MVAYSLEEAAFAGRSATGASAQTQKMAHLRWLRRRPGRPGAREETGGPTPQKTAKGRRAACGTARDGGPAAGRPAAHARESHAQVPEVAVDQVVAVAHLRVSSRRQRRDSLPEPRRPELPGVQAVRPTDVRAVHGAQHARHDEGS